MLSGSEEKEGRYASRRVVSTTGIEYIVSLPREGWDWLQEMIDARYMTLDFLIDQTERGRHYMAEGGEQGDFPHAFGCFLLVHWRNYRGRILERANQNGSADF